MGQRQRSLTVAWVTAFVTGWIALAIGTGWDEWVLVVHGASGLAAVALAPWRDIAHRSGDARQWRSAVNVTAFVLIAVAGVLHTTGLWVGRGDYAALTVHIVVAMAVVIVLTTAAVVTRARPRAAPPTRSPGARRDFLKAGLVAAAAIAARSTLEGVTSIAGLDGADRRYTGSIEVASFNPGALPTTNWLTDHSPEVDVDAWRLVTGSGSVTRRWTYAELVDAGTTVDATIDCTGAWYSTQQWFGVALDELLAGVSGRSIEVRSLTGYSRLFPAVDRHRLWLAVRVGGIELSRGHGFPARLVAPGRRGFWWVKWVDEIRVTNRPWWLQSPFPLQ